MSTVRSKDRVTAPKGIRDYLGLKAGSTVTSERAPTGKSFCGQARGRARRPASVFARLRGRATVRMSTDEIMALTRGS